MHSRPRLQPRPATADFPVMELAVTFALLVIVVAGFGTVRSHGD
jgi:hypothetical protein